MAVNSGLIDPNLLTDPNNPGTLGQQPAAASTANKPNKKVSAGGFGGVASAGANVQQDDPMAGHKLGASLFEVNPILGLIGTLAGGMYDYATAGDRVKKVAQGTAQRTADWTTANNIYRGDGYMQDGQPNLAWHAEGDPEVPEMAMGGPVKKKMGYANGGPVEPQKTQLGISADRMAASDALAAQIEEGRTRVRPLAPQWSKRDNDLEYRPILGVGGITQEHDGRAFKGNFIGMPYGPPVDLNKYDGTPGSSYRPTYPIGYANGGPIDPPKASQMYNDSLTLYNYGANRGDRAEYEKAHDRLTKANGVYPEYNLPGDADGWTGYKKPMSPSGSAPSVRDPGPQQMNVIKPTNQVSLVPIGRQPMIGTSGTYGGFSGGFVDPRVGPPADGELLTPAQNQYRQNLPATSNFANGGSVPAAGHVIPAENAAKVIGDGKKAGVDLSKPMQQVGEQVGGTVPGTGGPKADDKQIKPAGSGAINVSSGEVFVSDDLMQRLAKIAGLSTTDYGQSMYPKAEGGKNMAMGGPVEGDPPKQPPIGNINTKMMSPDAADMEWDKRNPLMMELRPPDLTPLALRNDQKNPVKSSSTIASGNDADTATGPDTYEQMKKWNRDAAVIQGGAQIGSLAYNIFSKRTPGTPPANFTPEKLDLKTGAYKAKLESDRKLGTATAIYNTKDKQGLGRDLGIIANDLSARLDIAGRVEGVQNQERTVNNQAANQASLFNTQQRNAYQQQEAAASNQFRAMKGQAVSQSLGELVGVTSDYLNNQISIEDRRNMNVYQQDYLKYLGNAKGYENMSPVDFYKNYQPQLQGTQATAP